MKEKGLRGIAIGRDGRLSSPEMSRALIDGLRMSGIDVTDVGMVPTPVAYFAAHHLRLGSAIAVTGSHNPPDYNGFKIVVDGETWEKIGNKDGRCILQGELIAGNRIANGAAMMTETAVTRRVLGHAATNYGNKPIAMGMEY
jgi:phosphomannomutase/phosphoglucomutase